MPLTWRIVSSVRGRRLSGLIAVCSGIKPCGNEQRDNRFAAHVSLVFYFSSPWSASHILGLRSPHERSTISRNRTTH